MSFPRPQIDKPISKLKKLSRLSLQEWGLLIRALVFLPWAALLLRVRGYRRTLQWFSLKPVPGLSSVAPRSLESARNISRMVDIAARYGPYRAKCLCRSLVLIRLLAKCGMAGQLIIGARYEDEEFGAHAWVLMDGQVVNDNSHVELTYSRFRSAGHHNP